MLRRWNTAILMAVCGVLLAAAQVARGSVGDGVTGLLAFLALALLMSPWALPRSVSAAQAHAASLRDGRPIVYWRPGCRYCLQLRIHLGHDARRLHWVDIWRDPAGAATVRAVADGNETVPTVVIAGQAFVNPDRKWLREQIRAS
ncbi:glutaredoxin domain-containing protein [Micromonospora sp. GCM10011542]|uniref:glutaredoxin domain-containing protein n=1 Tax=Micromonospora sp. GCM10011542 TaxID=3317337 RepID=UPI0036175469